MIPMDNVRISVLAQLTFSFPNKKMKTEENLDDWIIVMEHDGAICGYQPEILKGYLLSDGCKTEGEKRPKGR